VTIKFKVITTPTFEKETIKLTKSDKSIKNKLSQAMSKLEKDPFQGQRIEGTLGLGERRIWVGDGYRLFYDIDGSNIVLLHLKKKDKNTYR